MPGLAPAHMPKGSSRAAAWGGGLPVRARLLPLAPEALQLSGFETRPAALAAAATLQMLFQQCLSLPARLCPCPCPCHCPCAPLPTLPQLPAAVQGLRHRRQRARELPRHAVHGERGRARQPPTCLRAAGQARKSQRFLRSPGPGAFSSGAAWPQPNRGVLPGLLLPGWRGRAGVRPQLCIPWPQPKPSRSGLGDARRGRGASLPPSSLLRGRLPGQPPAACPACAQAGTLAAGVRGQGAGCLQPGPGGIKPLVLRWANRLMCSGRTLPVQTSISSTVGWQWRNGGAVAGASHPAPPSQHRWQRRRQPREADGAGNHGVRARAGLGSQLAALAHPPHPGAGGTSGVEAGPAAAPRRHAGRPAATAGVGRRRGGSALAHGRGAHPSPTRRMS